GLAPWSPALVTEAVGFGGLVLVGIMSGLVTRITHVELSNMRPARLGEATHGFAPVAVRLALAYLLLTITCGLVAALFRSLPAAVGPAVANLGGPRWLAEATHTGLAGVGTVVEIVLWFALGLSWPIAPVLVVEGCAVLTA